MIAPPWGDEEPDGKQLGEAIRAHARRNGIALTRLCAPMSDSPAKWLSHLELAKKPKRQTIARVAALLAGLVPLPPDTPAAPKEGKWPKPRATTGQIVSARDTDTERPRAPYREPCFRCGTRADIGCRHQRPYPSLPGDLHP